jgi:opacity protein-like surface antigen
MKSFLLAAAVAATLSGTASASDWSASVPFTNQVADDVIVGGGYAGYDPGATAPNPGSCRSGLYNANRSESWIAVKPGTEDLVGTSKIFFEKFSTFYNFHLGSHTFANGTYAGSSMVTGYECISTGTQEMPPSWTNNTDPNVDFDSQGRAYQVTLPFNAFWANLHPNSNIGIVYSDDLGRTWVKGNGGEPLENAPNWSSLSFGFVEDKQWVAVNHFPGTRFQDHVYAAWGVYNGSTAKIKVAVSEDRGQTFRKAVTVTRPRETSTLNEYVYPTVDAGGDVYLVIASSSPSNPLAKTIYVSRSRDDGRTWGPWVAVAQSDQIPACCLPNTRFRDGILEHFTASPTYPGHLYVTWEDWDGTQFDVKFSQSTDGGMTWSAPIPVNDADPNDQFQPSVAAGPGGAVAIAFYDRRQACPTDATISPGSRGRTNVCIDVTLQAFKDSGAGAVPVGGNVRFTQFTWDPEQPVQTIDGLDQMACAAHQNPCTTRSFIGDYFGLAISANNVYGFFVSTHYPSSVIGDQGTPVHYQQQVLATASRAALGI